MPTRASMSPVVKRHERDCLSKPKGNIRAKSIGRRRVLCVDDDPNVLAAMQRSFRRFPIELHCAYHGMQGIVEAVSRRPDLIITDLKMPLASGEELIDCLSRNPATTHTPIVVLTGQAVSRKATRSLGSGVHEVLEKPLVFDDLLEAISGWIDVDFNVR